MCEARPFYLWKTKAEGQGSVFWSFHSLAATPPTPGRPRTTGRVETEGVDPYERKRWCAPPLDSLLDYDATSVQTGLFRYSSTFSTFPFFPDHFCFLVPSQMLSHNLFCAFSTYFSFVFAVRLFGMC